MTVAARARRWSLPLLVVLGAWGAPVTHPGGPPDRLVIETLSNRADLISGGDVLIGVRVPPSVPTGDVVVRAGGRDVTGALTADARGHRLTGVVGGLPEGDTVLTAGVRIGHRFGWWGWDGPARTARLTVTNHPGGGPVLSGAQVQPWICATPTAQPGDATTPHTNASGMAGTAVGDRCDIPTEYHLWYRPTTAPAGCAGIAGANPCFRPYDPAGPPADVATTTTDRGVTVPFIVRVERGTLNRGIYDLAVLFDPAAEPGRGTGAWNGKVQHSFGPSTGSPRRQFAPLSAWYSTSASGTNDEALARGFLTSVSSLTDQLLNSNQVVAAETLMMIEEHITERYGPIRYVMGTGCSGGSILQTTVASMYPGLLDGLQVSCTFPDSVTTATEVGDCVLLARYFDSPAFAALTAGRTPAEVAAERAAIAGHRDERGCMAWSAAYSQANLPGNVPDPPATPARWTPPTAPRADAPNNCLLPATMVYDPVTSPTGVRCGGAEQLAPVLGRADDPAFPGRANRTGDNVGVEYGRGALLSGAITPEGYVTLNERIGGGDPDGVPTPERMVADRPALRTAYRSGLVADGHTLARVPIVDLRGNDDSGIHHDWRSFALRQRLDDATGRHDNLVMWRFGPSLLPPPSVGLPRRAFDLLDRWLTAVEADRSPAPVEWKVRRARPAAAHDFCYLSTDPTYSTEVTDEALCDADPVLRHWSSPRQVAGGPLAEDVLKCRLRPLDAADLPGVAFTAGQWERLRNAFPDGVCDWSRPGVGQAPATPWMTYGAGPGGRPLPPPPTSR